MNRSRRSLFALGVSALVLIACLVVLVPRLYATATDGPITNPTDFRAFYCGGSAIAGRADPYRVQPLMGCEQRALAASGLHMLPNFVLPAPLPPYALAAFAIVSLLPFPLASAVWCAVSLALVCATVVVVRELTRLPAIAVAAALVASDGLASLVIGQIVPVVVLSLAGCALALRRERYVLAALGFGVAMIEPHVALPVGLAVLTLVPGARVPLGVACLALAILSFVAVGWATNIEYFSVVLPAHARSEVAGFGAQYSLTSLAYALGFSEGASVLWGETSYVATTVAGIALAARLRDRWNDAAVVALVPPALATFGGVFVHIHQMAAAIPLALLVLAKEPKLRTVSLAVVVALAIPWESIAETPGVMHAYARGQVAHVHAIAVPRPDDLAEVPEVAYIRSGGTYRDGRTFLQALLWKAPTWLALAALIALAAALARRPRAYEPAA
ncbi:MAG: hypothetical protein NVS3B17_14890 [Vulcanimicrobiaceae bacterium]